MDVLSTKNIIHSDLTVGNMLLTEALDPKVSDAGLSRRLYSALIIPRTLRLKDEEQSLSLPIKLVAVDLPPQHELVPIKSDVWWFRVAI